MCAMRLNYHCLHRNCRLRPPSRVKHRCSDGGAAVTATAHSGSTEQFATCWKFEEEGKKQTSICLHWHTYYLIRICSNKQKLWLHTAGAADAGATEAHRMFLAHFSKHRKQNRQR